MPTWDPIFAQEMIHLGLSICCLFHLNRCHNNSIIILKIWMCLFACRHATLCHERSRDIITNFHLLPFFHSYVSIFCHSIILSIDRSPRPPRQIRTHIHPTAPSLGADVNDITCLPRGDL